MHSHPSGYSWVLNEIRKEEAALWGRIVIPFLHISDSAVVTPSGVAESRPSWRVSAEGPSWTQWHQQNSGSNSHQGLQKYSVLHRITSLHCETPCPGGGTPWTGPYITSIWGLGTPAPQRRTSPSTGPQLSTLQPSLHQTVTTILTNWDRLYSVTLSQHFCINAFIVIFLLSCTSNLKSFSRWLCVGSFLLLVYFQTSTTT